MFGTTSPDTKAVLLLTSSLGAKRADGVSPPLTPSEYRKVARRLHDLKCSPADLIAVDARSEAAIEGCAVVIDPGRLRNLLARGLLLSQALERWSARAIWVASKRDATYPQRLRSVMRGDAPPVLFGSGNPTLLESSALAVVGSRKADPCVLSAAEDVARFAAEHDIVLVSGGAKGIDRAAMLAALHHDGRAVGVLADSLERAVVEPAYRDALRSGRLLLLSPFDPSARFQIWAAMQRNKIIYAAADAGLVVESAVSEGGTWAGAVEQLSKCKYVPVFVRTDGPPSEGLDALQQKGAARWPMPVDRESFMEAVSRLQGTQTSPLAADQLDFGSPADGALPVELGIDDTDGTGPLVLDGIDQKTAVQQEEALPESVPHKHPLNLRVDQSTSVGQTGLTPADMLFSQARTLILGMLDQPRSLAEVACTLGVSKPQAQAWLDRMVQRDDLHQPKRARYELRQPSLL